MSRAEEMPGYAGCPVPSDRAIERQDRQRDEAAQAASRALLAAMRRAGATFRPGIRREADQQRMGDRAA